MSEASKQLIDSASATLQTPDSYRISYYPYIFMAHRDGADPAKAGVRTSCCEVLVEGGGRSVAVGDLFLRPGLSCPSL